MKIIRSINESDGQLGFNSDIKERPVQESDDLNAKIKRLENNAGAISDSQQEFNRLLSKGMRLLSMREHSVKELSEKLTVNAKSHDLVYAVLDELVEKNYVSDERFAESYVRSRSIRGFGPVKIRAELSAKGIAAHLIDEFIKPNDAIWYDNAFKQYQKKYGDEVVSDYNTWTKRARFMQSRGFTMQHIQVSLPTIDFD